MKGIAHFVTGVALSTFFPQVVEQAAAGSLLPMLGGIGGLLPDTLDFKFGRYFVTYDVVIDPGPEPDPAAIADTLVDAMRKAYGTGEDQHVMAHTVRLGADLWRRYSIRFDPPAGEVVVRIGPQVTTSQVPYEGTEPQGNIEARCKIDVPLVDTYSDEYIIDIFSGPSFRFAREGDQLFVHFLDWHRRWSHSFGVALLIGGAFGLGFGPWAGGLAALGAVGHILEDQLGYMGSNLGWPFTKKRTPGLKLIHSGDAIPNFLTVWTSVILVLFNLDRFSPDPRLPQPAFLLGTLGLPWLALGGLYLWRKLRAPLQTRLQAFSEEFMRQAEMIAEVENARDDDTA
jgi:membrane-bound metal-dependent hydrolase YbcI (DUF457 family)